MMRVTAVACLFLVCCSVDASAVIEEAARQYKASTGSDLPKSAAYKTATLDEFEDFIKQNNKIYRNEIEKQYRFKVFQVNNLLAQVYQMRDQGTAQYGTTKFSDMTREEFKQYYRNLKISADFEPSGTAAIPNIKAPSGVDWRKKGAVTPVKNQEQCGSCWSFSATGNLEGQWFIKKGQLISLSEQQIVDCDKACFGCGGGFPFLAFDYIKQAGGIESEAEYRYTARDGQCKFDKSKVVATLNGYVNLTSNEAEMATWCAANGPISIAVNADPMQMYRGGIAHPTRESCNPQYLDHAILIVGYDVSHDPQKGDIPYWIVKNSWGADWGEQGYWLVYRGDGVCGLNRQTASAIVD